MAKPRVQKLLSLRTDTPEFLEALDALSLVQNEDKIKRDARRYLRFELEERSLELIETFVFQSTKVQDSLRKIKGVVEDLEKECGNALTDLESAERATTRFVEESGTLRQQRKEAEDRARSVSEFLKRFQLTPPELEALNLRDGTRNPDLNFFKALERVHKIRDECSELLSGTHQSAGMEIFEQMASHQSHAQDVTYSWIKRECADGSAGRELEQESKRLLYALAFTEFKQGSPAYYSHGVELVAKARRVEVTRKFNQQVNEKQLDNLILDPVRHLSDLLTTLHEICAEERDLYQHVFHTRLGNFRSTLQSSFVEEDLLGTNTTTTTNNNNTESPTKETHNKESNSLDPAEQQECLEWALSGISMTLRQRGMQIIESMHDSVACFKVVQMIDFYTDMMLFFFPLATTNSEEDNPVLVVKQLKSQAKWRFLHLAEDKAAELAVSARTRALPGSDLSASFEVLELVRCLRDVLSAVRDQSMVVKSKETFSEDAIEALNAFVGPIRNLVQSADQTFGSRADACIFAVNNLAALQGVLTLHDFTSSIVEELTFEIGERIDLLARIRAEAALNRSGLFMQSLIALEKVPSSNVSHLSDQPGLRYEQIKAAFDSFYRDLSGSLVMPEFDRIDAPRLRHQARNATCMIILNSHNRLYDAVVAGGYPDSSFLIHSKEQVRDLLDV